MAALWRFSFFLWISFTYTKLFVLWIEATYRPSITWQLKNQTLIHNVDIFFDKIIFTIWTGFVLWIKSEQLILWICHYLENLFDTWEGNKIKLSILYIDTIFECFCLYKNILCLLSNFLLIDKQCKEKSTTYSVGINSKLCHTVSWINRITVY